MNVRWFSACILSLVAFSTAFAQEPKAPLVEAQRKQQFEAMIPILAETFAKSPDDALFLEGTLSLLSVSEAGRLPYTVPSELLQRLAERRWRAPPGESPADWWARQQRELDYVRDDRVTKYRELLAASKEINKRPALQDWRAQSDLWKDLCVTLRGSLREKDPASLWRDKIPADEKHAILYRRCYAEAAIVSKAELDFELVRPILEPKTPQPAHELRRVAEVLRMLALSKCSPDDPRREELLGRLKPLINRPELHPTELAYLAQLDSAGGEERQMLRSSLVRSLKPWAFGHFAGFAQIPVETQQQLYWARVMTVSYQEKPLREVLRQLQSAVSLSIWIDDAAAADETPISLEESGPWLTILERVLGQSKQSLYIRPSGELWIGPPERKGAAIATWNRGLVKAASAKGELRAALHDPTTLEFVRTPLEDVLAYLSDLHQTRVVLRPQAVGGSEISTIRHGIPLFLALELLAEESKLNWDAVGEVLVFGTPAEIKRLRQLQSHRFRLLAELTVRNGPAREKLLEPTTLEFLETPLADVCAYLSDLHRLPVAIAAGDSSRGKLTVGMKGLELGAALDIAALDSGLRWSSDGEAIYLGSNDEVAEFLKLRKAREGKRAKYTAEVGAKMKLPIKVRLEDVPLSKAAPALSELIGLPVELPADDTELGKIPVRANFTATPADVMLDLLCLTHGLAWETTDKRVVIKRGKR